MLYSELELIFRECIAVQYLMFMVAVIIPNSLRSLTTKKLIEKCINSSRSSPKAWEEFKTRFDQHIQYSLYNTYIKFNKYDNSNELNETLKDLKQDIYIKLLDNNYESLRKFKGTSTTSLKAYLAVISHHLALNFINRHKKRFVTDEHLENEVDHHSSPLTDNSTFPNLEEQFLRDAIIQVLKKHHNSRKFNRDAVIFKLFYFEGFTSKELADKFDITASGIETLVSRMKKVLAEHYNSEEGQ